MVFGVVGRREIADLGFGGPPGGEPAFAAPVSVCHVNSLVPLDIEDEGGGREHRAAGVRIVRPEGGLVGKEGTEA